MPSVCVVAKAVLVFLCLVWKKSEMVRERGGDDHQAKKINTIISIGHREG